MIMLRLLKVSCRSLAAALLAHLSLTFCRLRSCRQSHQS